VLQLRIQGRGGQGAQMAGEALARAYFDLGKYVQAYSTYGGARRGSPVSTSIRIDDDPIRERCNIDRPDGIVCFDATLLSPALFDGADEGTSVLINCVQAPEEFPQLDYPHLATIDAIAVAQANGLGRIVNSAVLGALARLMGEPEVDFLAQVVHDVSPAKRPENANAVRDGYRLVRMRKDGAS
jgi:pyruvate ferredoxin oxidoreductase gamma subunit